MFQIFDSTAVSNNIHQENNVAAKKHEISNRKALKDIDKNKKICADSVADKQTLNNDKENDFKIDICSYKDVPDTYNDVMGPPPIDLLKKTIKCVTPPIMDFEVEGPNIFEFDNFKFNVEIDLQEIICALRMPHNLC